MTAASDMTGKELAAARDQARRAVAGLIAGAGLQVSAQTYELLIVNPRDLGQGTIHVDYADGKMYWERTVWDDLGQLPGYGVDAGAPQPVNAGAICAALNVPYVSDGEVAGYDV